MAFQIIFVVESDERSRSDFIYIRSVLDRWYDFRKKNDVKISPVFMGGKGNYCNRKVVNTIKTCISQYNRIGKTFVVYCFDTDKYDSDPNEKRVLNEEMSYCSDSGYEFVWFCHDVEEVFLGESVSKGEKTNNARRYIVNDWINDVNKNNLDSEDMVKGKSNLMRVLDKIFEKDENQ